jgi:hypothetical protein
VVSEPGEGPGGPERWQRPMLREFTGRYAGRRCDMLCPECPHLWGEHLLAATHDDPAEGGLVACAYCRCNTTIVSARWP